MALDLFTKSVELAAIPNKSAETVARALCDIVIYRHGIPGSLLTDRGLEFDNRHMAMLAQGVDITIPVTCSVFEPDPMTSQCTRGVPRLKFRHKIDEMWVIFSFVALASL